MRRCVVCVMMERERPEHSATGCVAELLAQVDDLTKRCEALSTGLRETLNVLLSAAKDDTSSIGVPRTPWWHSRVGIAVERIRDAIKSPEGGES